MDKFKDEIIQKSKLEDVKVIEENGKYYLDVSLLCETQTKVLRLKSKLEFPLRTEDLRILITEDKFETEFGTFYKPSVYVCEYDFGFIKLKSANGVEVEFVGDKKVDMTLEDIEKELGYKINLISGK